jgi:hypothetical protein
MFAEHDVLGIEIGGRRLKAYAKGLLGIGALLIIILGLTGAPPGTYLPTMLRKLEYLPCLPTAAP